MSAAAGGAGRDPPLTALRLRLRTNGFPPVPVSGPRMRVKSAGKRPVMEDWRRVCAVADEVEVRRWAVAEPNCTNTGILCDDLACLDIDVSVPELAAEIETLAISMLGPTSLRRIGQAPKSLLAYRTTAAVAKMATPELFLPDGTKLQVEILGAGQQFVAYGEHPDTGHEYVWTETGPDVVARTDLPVANEDRLRAFVAAAEAILRDAGGQTKAEREAATGGSSQPRPDDAPEPNKGTGGPRSGVGRANFFKAVNRAALDNLAAWVPKLFPNAKLQPATGAYRVTSTDLDRAYEEDLSLHPDGVQDFGLRKGLSPCDLVMEWGGAPTVQAAAHTLCEWLGRSAAEFGWKGAADSHSTDRPNGADTASDPPPPQDEIPGLCEFLGIEAWAAREMPAPDRLLGDLVTTTTRTFLVGRTGLGKTLLALAFACGMASGQGFLHWRSGRAAKVLVIDGEMPGELIRQRAIDTLRRGGIAPEPGRLLIYARDMEDQFAERYPTMGRMPPLNTENGRQWALALIGTIGGVDVVIFDNVMSLITGDQKDEVPWSDTLELVQTLTARRIGQLWLDHTGHDSSRQYGSSTKAWRFDAVGVMAPLPEDQRRRGEVAFTLSFEHPGKARRRTPDNWEDFEPCTLRLVDDTWSAETARPANDHTLGKVKPSRILFYDALVAAIGRDTGSANGTTLSAWEAECMRRGLIERPTSDKEDYRKKDARFRDFRKAKSDLLGARWITIREDVVIDLKGQRR